MSVTKIWRLKPLLVKEMSEQGRIVFGPGPRKWTVDDEQWIVRGMGVDENGWYWQLEKWS